MKNNIFEMGLFLRGTARGTGFFFFFFGGDEGNTIVRSEEKKVSKNKLKKRVQEGGLSRRLGR
jgi:hypothetical protein